LLKIGNFNGIETSYANHRTNKEMYDSQTIGEAKYLSKSDKIYIPFTLF
jgi:hypothetical protein